MKPEDIPQWAWDEADDTTYNIETDGHGSIEYTEARASIARLVMKARSQAYEECAKIADKQAETEELYMQGTDKERDEYKFAAKMFRFIAKSIRQHSQKGENE